MSEGPMMLVATSMLRPPPTRIGKLGENFTLPRTIPLLSAISGGVGAFLGLAVSAPFLGIGGFEVLLLGAVLGGAAGVAAVTLSPLRGESLARWMGLQVQNARHRRVQVNGRPARVYIGIAPLSATAMGRVRLVPGAVDVVLGNVDERGVLIPHAEILERRRLAALELRSSRSGDWRPQPSAPSVPLQHLPKSEDATAGRSSKARPAHPKPSIPAQQGAESSPRARKRADAPKKLTPSKNKPLTPPKR